jgi:tubulin epsilon
MVRELITVQVGQCGNQIAARFWELALDEHAQYSRADLYDEALSSFFKNVHHGSRQPVGSRLHNLKARALVVDMEEGVINSMLKSRIGELFDQKQFIHDVSGAGNNWAHGHYEYGRKYATLLEEKVRALAE